MISIVQTVVVELLVRMWTLECTSSQKLLDHPKASRIGYLLIRVVLCQRAQAAAPMVMSKEDLMARMRQ